MFAMAGSHIVKAQFMYHFHFPSYHMLVSPT